MLQFRLGLDAVQIDVRKRQTTLILVDQDEGRTVHEMRRHFEAGCDAPHKRGLSRPQLSIQRQHLPSS